LQAIRWFVGGPGGIDRPPRTSVDHASLWDLRGSHRKFGHALAMRDHALHEGCGDSLLSRRAMPAGAAVSLGAPWEARHGSVLGLFGAPREGRRACRIRRSSWRCSRAARRSGRAARSARRARPSTASPSGPPSASAAHGLGIVIYSPLARPANCRLNRRSAPWCAEG
jgi:hypothetical protein